MVKLTPTQKNLLHLINSKKDKNGIFEYNEMKNKCIDKFKSFDGSFNALLFKNHLKHFITSANKNTFITTIK